MELTMNSAIATLKALTTAVIDSPGCPGAKWGPGATDVYTDASYTLLQPVRGN
jgi:hypothetical protein